MDNGPEQEVQRDPGSTGNFKGSGRQQHELTHWNVAGIFIAQNIQLPCREWGETVSSMAYGGLSGQELGPLAQP